MRFRTEAIVLNARPYGEADLIVRFFTRDRGLCSGFAKSPRKIGSRYGASFEPLTHLRLTLMGREGAGLPRVTQGDILHAFQSLRDDLPILMRLSASLRLVTALLHEEEPHARKFDLLLAALTQMEKTRLIELTDTAFQVKFLWMAGYGPRVDACGRCGRPFAGDHARFFPAHGALLCRTCAGRETGDGIRMGRKSILYFGHAKGRTFEALAAEPPEAETLCEAHQVLGHFVAHLTGGPHGNEQRVPGR